LVLDDYHVITTPPIHEALTFLLDHLPPTLRLIISTREDPPLPLARWRARGQLSEIRADDLRFSSERDTEPGVRAEPDSDRSEPVGTAFESVAPASLF
jgi:ATP/maltotriose-dependent transcriptional regulator MalT